MNSMKGVKIWGSLIRTDVCDCDEGSGKRKGGGGNFGLRRKRGQRGMKSNFHNSSRSIPDFDVNYSIQGLFFPSEGYEMKGRGGAKRGKIGGEERGNSLNRRKHRGKNWGRQRDSDAPHSSIGEVKSYRLIYFIR